MIPTKYLKRTYPKLIVCTIIMNEISLEGWDILQKNVVIGILTFLLIVIGCATFMIKFPFYYESMVVGFISLIVIPLLRKRTMFLYTITIIILYGVYLTVRSFIDLETTDIQLLYTYNHLLFTAFLLMYWILLTYLKRMGYENERLAAELKKLQRFYPSGILSNNEFYIQSDWLLRSMKRDKKQAWFIRLNIIYENKRVQHNLQSTIEEVVLRSIRDKFDLVTSKPNEIFIMLKDTNEDGIKIVLDRIRSNAKEKLNFIEPPYEVSIHEFTNMELLNDLNRDEST